MSRTGMCVVAMACLTLGKVHAQDAKVAHITIISEKGVPHSAVILEYPDGKTKWLGFKPKNKLMPFDDGIIDESDSSKVVDKYVRFVADPAKLAELEKKVREEFKDKKYVVSKYDCVSLSVAFAKGLDFKVPDKPNLIPGKLVDNLAKLNQDLNPVAGTGDDKKPFPWCK